eukprot:Skav217856  [mRNA]  locus=scaffold5889:53329:54288:- [translate_table: standard]
MLDPVEQRHLTKACGQLDGGCQRVSLEGACVEADSSGIPCLWFPAPKAATVILFFHANADTGLRGRVAVELWCT